MSSSDLRIAFVGAGVVSGLHHAALARSSDAHLAGLFDVDQDQAQLRSKEWGVTSFATYDELLASDEVDAVFVLCTNRAHEETALRAIDAGKHVLIEKPVADEFGCARLASRALASGVVCMPAHNYAYHPEFLRMLRLVREGALGDIRVLWINYVLGHEEDIAARYQGVVSELLVHHSYLTYALMGPPDRIHAGRMRPGWKDLRRDDQAWMVWEYDTHASAHLFGSFAMDDDTADPWTFIVKVLGTEGGVTYSWRSAHLRGATAAHRFSIPAYEESYEHELAAFVRAVRGDPAAVVSTITDAGVVAQLLTGAGLATGVDQSDYTSNVFDTRVERPPS